MKSALVLFLLAAPLAPADEIRAFDEARLAKAAAFDGRIGAKPKVAPKAVKKDYRYWMNLRMRAAAMKVVPYTMVHELVTEGNEAVLMFVNRPTPARQWSYATEVRCDDAPPPYERGKAYYHDPFDKLEHITRWEHTPTGSKHYKLSVYKDEAGVPHFIETELPPIGQAPPAPEVAVPAHPTRGAALPSGWSGSAPTGSRSTTTTRVTTVATSKPPTADFFPAEVILTRAATAAAPSNTRQGLRQYFSGGT